MTYFAAFFIFLALTSASWFVSKSLYKSTFEEDQQNPGSWNSTVSLYAIGTVTLLSFVSFPAGYILSVVAWAVAVYGYLKLPTGRATVLVGYLSVASIVTRLVVLGVLDLTA